MSLRAMLWALNDAPTENPTQAFVLVALADNAWDDGRGAWPVVATIAKRVRASERTVQTTLRALEANGLIRRGDQSLAAGYGHHGTVWELALELVRQDDDEPPKKGADSAPLPKKGATDDKKRVQRAAPKPRPRTVHKSKGVTHQEPEVENDPPYWDVWGRLLPRCDGHWEDESHGFYGPPCWACAAVKPEFDAAEVQRVLAADRQLREASRRAVKDAETEAVPPPDDIAKAKAALRVRRRPTPPTSQTG